MSNGHWSSIYHLLLNIIYNYNFKMDPKQEAHYLNLQQYGDWQEVATLFKIVPSKQKKDKLSTLENIDVP